MKKILTLVAILSLLQTKAQVQFQQISLQDAISKASQTGKVVFAQFASTACDRCNEVAEASLEDKAVGKLVNAKCIPIKIDENSADRQQFIEMYNTSHVFGTFFLTGDGDLLHLYPKSTTKAEEYITQVNIALSKIIEGQASLRELNDEWKNNPDNFLAMEKNLQKRSSLYLATDSMLEIYVSRLPTDSTTSIRTLSFIVLQRPTIFSEAHKVLHKDASLFNTVWNSFPLATRVRLNSSISYKSMRKAIAKKDLSMAFRAALFTAGTHEDRQSENARRGFEKKMLDYYVGIKDTVSYLNRAVSFYQRFMMTISVQETMREDSVMRKKLLAAAPKDTVYDPAYPGKYTIKTSIPYSSKASFLASELNKGARLIYTSTSDTVYLNRAVEWSKRSMELFKNAITMDTYARLLYKMNNKQEAIAWEEKALNAGKKPPIMQKTYEETLAKMKNDEVVN